MHCWQICYGLLTVKFHLILKIKPFVMPSTFFYLIFSCISWKIFLLATDPILQRYSISSVFHLCSGLRQEVFITYFCNYLFSFHFIDSSPERWNINYSIELNLITDQMMYVSSTNSRLQFMDLLVCLSRRQGAVPASTSLGWSLSAWYTAFFNGILNEEGQLWCCSLSNRGIGVRIFCCFFLF